MTFNLEEVNVPFNSVTIKSITLLALVQIFNLNKEHMLVQVMSSKMLMLEMISSSILMLGLLVILVKSLITHGAISMLTISVISMISLLQMFLLLEIHVIGFMYMTTMIVAQSSVVSIVFDEKYILICECMFTSTFSFSSNRLNLYPPFRFTFILVQIL